MEINLLENYEKRMEKHDLYYHCVKVIGCSILLFQIIILNENNLEKGILLWICLYVYRKYDLNKLNTCIPYLDEGDTKECEKTISILENSLETRMNTETNQITFLNKTVNYVINLSDKLHKEYRDDVSISGLDLVFGKNVFGDVVIKNASIYFPKK